MVWNAAWQHVGLLAAVCAVWAAAQQDGASTSAAEPVADTALVAGEPASLDTVRVRARVRDAVENPLLESPALQPSLSVVDREDIEAQNAATVIDALEYVPGAWVESRGRKVKSFASVRGQKYPYPDYAVDGVWQREFEELPYFFPSADIERIEVIRSSAALINGVSGLTGIINIVPRSYDKLGLDCDLSYGSFDTYRATVNHGASLGPVQYSAGVGGLQTEGPEGKNAGEEAWDFYLRTRVSPGEKLTVQANVFGLYGTREISLIEYPGDTANASMTIPQRFDPHRALITNARTMYRFSDRMSGSLLLYYTRRNHDFYASDTASEPANPDLDWEWGANYVHAMSLFGQNVMRISLLYNNWVAPFGKRFYSGKRCAIQTLSAAVADEHSFGKLSVDLGVRWLKDYVDEFAAYNVDGSVVWRAAGRPVALDPVEDEWRKSQLNANLGLRYDLLPGISLTGYGAFGFVNPLPGTVDTLLKELEAERQTKVDIGVAAAHGTLGTATLSGFVVYRADGVNITSKWDTVAVNGDSLLMPLYENVDMRTAGVEAEVRTARFKGVAEGFANAALMRHQRRKPTGDAFVADNEKPEAIVGGGLRLYLGAFDLNVHGKYVSEYESSRFALNKETVEIGDFSTLDISGGYTYRLSSGQQFRVYVAVDNLTDVRYSTVVGYPDFGRKYTIGLRYHY